MSSSVFGNYFSAPPQNSNSFIGSIQKDFQNPDGVWRLCVKPFAKILSWSEFFFDGLAYPLQECKEIIGRVGLIRGISKLPEKLDKTVQAVKEWKDAFFEGLFWKLGIKTTDIYIHSCSSISVVADLIELSKDAGWYSLSSQQILILDIVGFMGSLALFLSSVKGLIEYGHTFLNEEIGSCEFKYAMLKIARKILLLAMSIIGMITFATGGVSSRLVLLSISTATFLVSTVSRYYKKTYLNPPAEKPKTIMRKLCGNFLGSSENRRSRSSPKLEF